MGILDYLILAGIAVGILAAVRHLKRNSGCGGCGGDCSHCEKKKIEKFFGEIFFSEDFYGISARGKEGYFLSSVHFFFEKQAKKNLQFFTNKHFFLNKKVDREN